MIKVFLAGEGRSELGSRDGHPAYQSDDEPGALESLLRAIREDGWHVVGAVSWRHIRKLRVNAPDEGDARSVQAAALHAAESGADVLAFVRDRDREPARETTVEDGISRAAVNSSLRIAGGVAIETLEGWLLAVGGGAGSEAVRHPEKEVARLGLEPKSTAHDVAHIEKHGLARIPADARSLRIWIERARVALEVESPATPA